MRLRGIMLAGMIVVGAQAVPASVEPPDHLLWDALLARHVRGGRVDYDGFRKDRARLEQYLQLLRQTRVGQGSKEEQLAFWINAYNACVIKGVLNHYPLQSVRDVRGFFAGIRYEVNGQALTLNEIEDKGRRLGDFRIHFTLVCASTSCPPLRPEAYVPKRLNVQLDKQARLFLSDPTRGARLEGNTLWLSQIFRWFKADFVHSRLPNLLVPDAHILPAIEPYFNLKTVSAIHGTPLTIKFMDYDWSLNNIR